IRQSGPTTTTRINSSTGRKPRRSAVTPNSSTQCGSQCHVNQHVSKPCRGRYNLRTSAAIRRSMQHSPLTRGVRTTMKNLLREENMKIDRSYANATEGTTPRLIQDGVSTVPAGYPSPSHDYSYTQIDLTEMLNRDELATVIVRVSGDSMEGAGIFDG